MAHLCDRVGARRLLWIALLAWAVLLCVLALMHEKWAFAAALVLTEVAGGAIDTAMNAEASHRLVDHPAVLVRLHALFNAGALTGAAAAARGHPRRRVLALDVARPSPSWPWRSGCGPPPPIPAPPMAAARRPGSVTAPLATAAPRRAARVAGRVRAGRGHRGRRRHLGRPVPAQPPGDGRAARGRRLRGRAGRGGDHPGRRRAGARAAVGSRRALVSAGAWPAPASCSSR